MKRDFQKKKLSKVFIAEIASLFFFFWRTQAMKRREEGVIEVHLADCYSPPPLFLSLASNVVYPCVTWHASCLSLRYVHVARSRTWPGLLLALSNSGLSESLLLHCKKKNFPRRCKVTLQKKCTKITSYISRRHPTFHFSPPPRSYFLKNTHTHTHTRVRLLFISHAQSRVAPLSPSFNLALLLFFSPFSALLLLLL